MKPAFDLVDPPFNTQFAPLCVVGHVLHERNGLDGILKTELIAQKRSEHSVGEKLKDAILLILAGYPSLYLINQHLRPDAVLAQAWHRTRLAEQSTISRVLDAFDAPALEKLSQSAFDFWQRHSQLPSHDWRKLLVVDLDLTPLLASRNAEASSKGYLGKKMQVVASWHASCCIPIMNRSSRSCIQGHNRVPLRLSQPFNFLKSGWLCLKLVVIRSFGEWMAALAVTIISSGWFNAATKSSPKGFPIAVLANYY